MSETSSRLRAVWWWLRLSFWTWKYYRFTWPLAEVTNEGGCWNPYFEAGSAPREAVLEGPWTSEVTYGGKPVEARVRSTADGPTMDWREPGGLWSLGGDGDSLEMAILAEEVVRQAGIAQAFEQQRDAIRREAEVAKERARELEDEAQDVVEGGRA